MLLQNFANFLCKKIQLPDFLFFHQLCSGLVIVTFTSFHLLFIVLTVFLLFVLVYIGLETNWLNVPTIKLIPKYKLVDMELHYFYLFLFYPLTDLVLNHIVQVIGHILGRTFLNNLYIYFSIFALQKCGILAGVCKLFTSSADHAHSKQTTSF